MVEYCVVKGVKHFYDRTAVIGAHTEELSMQAGIPYKSVLHRVRCFSSQQRSHDMRVYLVTEANYEALKLF